MRFQTVGSLIVAALCVLGGCDQKTDTGPQSQSSATLISDLNSLRSRYSQTADFSPQAEGYRPGVLSVSVQLEQVSDWGDDTGQSRQRKLKLSLEASEKVWVLPDLSVMVPEEGSDDLKKQSLQTEPFVHKGAAPRMKSLIYYAEDDVSANPDSDDATEIRRSLKVSAQASQVRVLNLYPSLFGKGYELELYLKLDGETFTRTTTTDSKGNRRTVTDNDGPFNDVIRFALYPPLTSGGLMPYRLLDAPDGKAEPITESELTQQLQRLLAIARIKPVQARGPLVGAVSMRSKDSLVVRYQKSGALAPLVLAGTQPGNSARPRTNQLIIEVSVKAAE